METEKNWAESTSAQFVTIVRRLNAWFRPMTFARDKTRRRVAYMTGKLETVSPRRASGATCRSFTRSSRGGWRPSGSTATPDVRPPPGLGEAEGGRAQTPGGAGARRAFNDDRTGSCSSTFVLTGLRRSELRALRWADVDLIETGSASSTRRRRPGSGRSRSRRARRGARGSTAADRTGRPDRVFCTRSAGSVYRYGFAEA